MANQMMLFWSIISAVHLGQAMDCSYTGGYAIRQMATCSDGGDAPVSCGGGYSWRCCPKDTVCAYMNGGNVYCCPSGKDCFGEVDNAPKCARDDWSLYAVSAFKANDAFCCAPGSYGVFASNYGSNGGVGCSPYGRPIDPDAVTGTVYLSLLSICAATNTGLSSIVSSRATSGSEATLMSQASQTSSPASSSTAATPDDGSSSSPSKGAIVGIAVGGFAGVALIAAAAWWIGRHRAATKHRNQLQSQPNNPPYTPEGWGTTPSPGGMMSITQPSEMAAGYDRTKVNELP